MFSIHFALVLWGGSFPAQSGKNLKPSSWMKLQTHDVVAVLRVVLLIVKCLVGQKRDPYVMVCYNPHITGARTSSPIYPKQLYSFFIAQRTRVFSTWDRCVCFCS